jgi:hypothetical protein
MSPDGNSSSPAPAHAVVRLAAAACLASLLLYASSLWRPVLSQDDFEILEQSWTWKRTRAALWVPQNEHAMPLGRLLTWGLVCLAGRQTALPLVCALVGPVALAVGMLLTFAFVSRERGHPLPGLVAMTLFGVTSVYQQAVFWFAAAFSVLALDTLLLALLAAQRWRRRGGILHLGLTLLGTALAPAWFASGILAGPLVGLYLLPWGAKEAKSWRPWLGTIAAAVGSGLFLAVSLPRTAKTILHLEHYGDRTAFELFDVRTGAVSTGRSLVDNLLPGQFGVGGLGIALPLPAACVVLAGLVAAGAWWWRRARERRLLLLGMGAVISANLLVYSARAAWDYEDMTGAGWTRYHLLPQWGLALFVAGGLTLTRRASEGPLTRRQVVWVAGLIAVCFGMQLPRGVVGRFRLNPKQEARLRHIEEVDARCREYHIGSEDARRALPPLDMPESTTKVNGWAFLWGSPDPRPRPPEEVRRLLGE